MHLYLTEISLFKKKILSTFQAFAIDMEFKINVLKVVDVVVLSAPWVILLSPFVRRASVRQQYDAGTI